MDENLATLIGLLLSDGSVYFDKSKRIFCIQFTNKVSKLREVFKSLMKDCFGVEKFSENRCKNGISIRVFSNNIANYLFKLSPTFRKLPCKSFPKCNFHSCVICSPIIDENNVEWPPCIIPEEILSDKSLVAPFLRGYSSGDGSVNINRKHSVYQVEIACFHPTLRNQILLCLNLLGISGWTKYKGVFISSKSELLKFFEIVGFLPESIVCDCRSKWIGTPKNSVLRLALD